MRKKHYISYALLGLLTIGCQEDLVEMNQVTVSVPIEIYTHQTQVQTRATGDPGLDDEITAPQWLYIWAFVKQTGGNVSLVSRKIDCSSSGSWGYTTGDAGSENQNSRYVIGKDVELTFSNVDLDNPQGKILAIATSHELSTAVTNITGQALLEAATENTSGWSSLELCDLYSNPSRDVENGKAVVNGCALSFNPVRLYHCAAKADFTWELSAAVQSNNYVQRIQIKNLPTSCKLFDPTHNAAGSGTSNIDTDISNRWIGREYRYVLQQPSGNLTYDVIFYDQSRNKTDLTLIPASETLHETFTGWYRVTATAQ